jgi:hypothetical protein
MKLLTQKQTNSIFSKHCVDSDGMQVLGCTEFNEAVNALLMDAKIVKSLLKQAKRIKEKNS